MTAAASSVGISAMAETVAEGRVTYSVSANSSIDSCGVGSSSVVRNDGGKWRRRAQRSTSPRSHSTLACRNRATHCEDFCPPPGRSWTMPVLVSGERYRLMKSDIAASKTLDGLRHPSLSGREQRMLPPLSEG